MNGLPLPHAAAVIGAPTDYLNAPSHVAAHTAHQAALDAITHDVGGVMSVTSSVPSAISGHNPVSTLVGTAELWGGMSYNVGTLIVPEDGLYDIALHGLFGSNATGTIRTLWAVSSANIAPGGQYIIGAYGPPITTAASSGLGALLSAAGAWKMTAGQPVSLNARQDSGAALTMTATLAVKRIH